MVIALMSPVSDFIQFIIFIRAVFSDVFSLVCPVWTRFYTHWCFFLSLCLLSMANTDLFIHSISVLVNFSSSYSCKIVSLTVSVVRLI